MQLTKSFRLLVALFAFAPLLATESATAQTASGVTTTIGRAKPVFLFCLDFSPDNTKVVVGGDAVRLFDLQSGQIEFQVQPNAGTRAVVFATNRNDMFATGDDDGSIRIWSLSSQTPVQVLQGHQGKVRALEISPDGNLLASSSVEYTQGRPSRSELKIWDVKSGKPVREIDLTDLSINCVAFSSDSRRLAWAKYPRDKQKISTVEIHEVAGWKLRQSIPFSPGFALSLSFTPSDKELLITGGICVPSGPNSCQPTGKLWRADAHSDQPATLLPTQPCDYFRSADVSSDGKRFVTGTAEVRNRFNASGRVIGQALIAQIQMRDTADGQLVWSAEGEVGDPYGVTLSPDGKTVACCSQQKILLFDSQTGQLLKSMEVTP